ncbi:hypothetical protein [Lysobacter capsici]|uniref:hypothetical protein n=1 Tax=Lysobacter capsici TaxID=435897 RepID=UPI001C001B12|nr:hypothetical protein [Lysobacter capsici]QWF18194.1 hypothetical protein KME82_05350 [Lysobacter capsici]
MDTASVTGGQLIQQGRETDDLVALEFAENVEQIVAAVAFGEESRFQAVQP